MLGAAPILLATLCEGSRSLSESWKWLGEEAAASQALGGGSRAAPFSWTNASEERVARHGPAPAGLFVLNVLKEELPERRRSRFSAFALGAGGYAVLIQAA
jgi:hypothetical protein